MSFANPHGEVGIMCPFVWMFIGSYEKLRNLLIDEKTLTSLIQLEYSGFAGATVPICTFTFHNSKIEGYKGGYIRLSNFVGANVQAPKALEAIKNPTCGWFYRRDASTFHQIPGSPIAYWASDGILHAFSSDTIKNLAFAGIGMRTGDNKRFLRFWNEVSFTKMGLRLSSSDEAVSTGAKWIPYNKGGAFRRWYGNNEYVVNWLNNGFEIKENTRRVYPELGDDLGWKISNEKYYYRPGLTWTGVTSGAFNCRLYDEGFIFDSGANGLFSTKVLPVEFFAGLLNCSVAANAFSFLNPTLNFGAGTVNDIPVVLPDETGLRLIKRVVSSCKAISEDDYDSFETSWDFKRSPLL